MFANSANLSLSQDGSSSPQFCLLKVLNLRNRAQENSPRENSEDGLKICNEPRVIQREGKCYHPWSGEMPQRSTGEKVPFLGGEETSSYLTTTQIFSLEQTGRIVNLQTSQQSAVVC